MYDMRRNLSISGGSQPPKSRSQRKTAFDKKNLYFRNSDAWLQSRVQFELVHPCFNLDKGSCNYDTIIISLKSPAIGRDLSLEPFSIINKITNLTFYWEYSFLYNSFMVYQHVRVEVENFKISLS